MKLGGVVKVLIAGLALVLGLFVACGKEDRRNGNCTLYGEECHDPKEGENNKNDPATGDTIGPQGPRGPAGQGCTIEPVSDGAVITCGNVEYHVYNGIQGVPGTPGTDGQDGYSVALATLLTAPSCSNGGRTILLATDINRNGQVDPLIDTNLQSLEICNGTNGSDGQDGEDGQDAPPTQFTPVAIIDPCGDAPGIADEIFLRLASNQLLWSFSDNQNGLNTRFSLAYPGSFKTTDGSNCKFTIDSNNNVINDHY